jgi:3-deoxy-manno-octulosonate cytidylyltransferase (CMP-KDO synthetase)
MNSARTVGVVPARLASDRFPRKVLEPLAGRPLVLHAYDRLSAATLVGDVLIATDSQEVESEAAGSGASVVLVTEPCATGSDRVARALADVDFDIAVNLQADHPLIDPLDIDRTIERLVGDPTLDITTLAYVAGDTEGHASGDVVKVVADAGGRALYFSRSPIPFLRENVPGKPLYLHHVGIYCFRRSSLLRFAELPRTYLEVRESLEQLRALEHGMAIGVVETEHASPGVDRPSDLEAAERRLAGRSDLRPA